MLNDIGYTLFLRLKEERDLVAAKTSGHLPVVIRAWMIAEIMRCVRVINAHPNSMHHALKLTVILDYMRQIINPKSELLMKSYSFYLPDTN